MKKKAQNLKNSMEPELDLREEDEQLLSSLPPKSDICQLLMDRFAKSPATQHRHLIASAAAMKSILQEENLPLTPLSYFAATISALNDAATESLHSDSDSVSSLSSFLSILLPLIPSGSISPGKASDAVDVLVLLLGKEEGVVSTATVRGIVKCLGELTILCDLEDWSKLRVPFETVFRFSVDKRPKVRKCSQVCVEKVFKSFQSSVVKEASKVVLSLFNSYMAHAIHLNGSKVVDGSKRELLSKPEHLEVVHMLNTLKFIAPYLSKKVSQKILSDLAKLLTCHFSPLTRHLFNILEAFLESSGADVILPAAENIIDSLASFVCSYEKNPTDTVMAASSLLKSYMGKFHGEEPIICTRKLPGVFGSLAGLLVVDTYSSQAAGILKEMINVVIDGSTFLGSEHEVDNKFMATEESSAIQSVCAVFDNILCNCDGIPNEHTLAVIATMFFKLGAVSYIFMKEILVKLAGAIMLEERVVTEKKHLQECIGSAVIAIGPEKILTLIPVSFNPEKQICSNIWLVPILSKYVTGASLEYFLKNIVPLVKALQQARRKVKKSPIRQHLQASIHGIWGLLPAFCRYPTDTHKCFEPLAKVFTSFLKEYSYMHEDIALALQELVDQNRSVLVSVESAIKSVEPSSTCSIDDFGRESRSVPSYYSVEVAARNIQALSSCSMDLLQALTDVFFDSPPKNRTHLKIAIGCLASVTESSKVKQLFISSLEKFKVSDVEAESDKLESDDCASVDKDLSENAKKDELDKEKKRGMVMEFAHSLIAGAQEDLLNTIFNYIKASLQVGSEIGQSEVYCTLSRIFEEHTWFYSSRFDEMVDLLLGIKAPGDITTLRSRFSCFQNLLVYVLKSDLDEGNSKAFLILNEIILALKDANEELRKEAYDILLKISDRLNVSSSDSTGLPHQQLFSMIMGYLSGSPPPIMSAAVAALSLLIYKNSGVCFSVPELVPSVLILLQSKAKEVIKAVLGFVKVLVSSVQANDLQKLLPDIVNGTLPWSSVSKNHFRLKVVTIFEIMTRKCGYAAVESLVPGRYKGFIKAVKEQRHGKTSSKEAETSDTVVPCLKRDNTRSRSVTDGEGIDLGTTQIEGINKKRKYNMPNKSSGFGKADKWVGNAKSARRGWSESRTGGSRKPFGNKDQNKKPYAGGQKNMRQRKEIKTRHAPSHKAGSASKFHKRRKTEK